MPEPQKIFPSFPGPSSLLFHSLCSPSRVLFWFKHQPEFLDSRRVERSIHQKISVAWLLGSREPRTEVRRVLLAPLLNESLDHWSRHTVVNLEELSGSRIVGSLMWGSSLWSCALAGLGGCRGREEEERHGRTFHTTSSTISTNTTKAFFFCPTTYYYRLYSLFWYGFAVEQGALYNLW